MPRRNVGRHPRLLADHLSRRRRHNVGAVAPRHFFAADLTGAVAVLRVSSGAAVFRGLPPGFCWAEPGLGVGAERPRYAVGPSSLCIASDGFGALGRGWAGVRRARDRLACQVIWPMTLGAGFCGPTRRLNKVVADLPQVSAPGTFVTVTGSFSKDTSSVEVSVP